MALEEVRDNTKKKLEGNSYQTFAVDQGASTTEGLGNLGDGLHR